MKKIASLFFILLGWLSIAYVYASNDLTSNDFTVNLKNMDPLGSRSSPQGWVWAIKAVLSSVSNILLFSIPIIAAVSFIIAGYYYIFSAGDSEKASRAKNIIKWNIVAITVALLSYAIVKIVASFFGG